MWRRFDVKKARAGGPAIVTFHGFLGHPEMWDSTLERSGRVGTVLSARLPGHGMDPWLPADWGFEAVVGEIAAGCTDLGSIWLLGYSMGARVALALALRCPEQISGAILIGAHPGLRDPDEREARARWDD